LSRPTAPIHKESPTSRNVKALFQYSMLTFMHIYFGARKVVNDF